MGDCDITIDELLGNKKKPESRFAKARRFIETILANGAVPAVEVMEKAEEQEISLSTLNRAKEALGAISIKQGDQWFWVLPIEANCTEVNKDTQDYQHSHAGMQDVSQNTSMNNLNNLTILPRQIIQEGC